MVELLLGKSLVDSLVKELVEKPVERPAQSFRGPGRRAINARWEYIVRYEDEGC